MLFITAKPGELMWDVRCVGLELCRTVRDDGNVFVVNVPGRTGMDRRITKFRSHALGGEFDFLPGPTGN